MLVGRFSRGGLGEVVEVVGLGEVGLGEVSMLMGVRFGRTLGLRLWGPLFVGIGVYVGWVGGGFTMIERVSRSKTVLFRSGTVFESNVDFQCLF